MKPVQVESQHPRTYTNENYSVDFSTIPIPNVISQNTFTPIVVDTAQDDSNKEDRDIFQNFEISPKKDTQEYMCYVCGEKAGKHSYYGGQVGRTEQNILTIQYFGFRFVLLVELSLEDQFSQNTMKYSNARLTNIALLHRKLEKLVNFAGKYEIKPIQDDIN